MICIMHEYLLEGAGSNLGTHSVVESLCRQGQTVHLFCQENDPDRYPLITKAIRLLPGRPNRNVPRAQLHVLSRLFDARGNSHRVSGRVDAAQYDAA